MKYIIKYHRLIVRMILPIISIVIGLFLTGYFIYNYVSDCEKAQWTPAKAIITDMNSYEQKDSDNHAKTDYVMTYTYNVNGVEYEGTLRSYNPIFVGQEIEIKYNPEMHSASTTLKEPDIKNFAMSLLFTSLFIIVGTVLTVAFWKYRFMFIIDVAKDNTKAKKHKIKINPKSFLPFLIPIAFFLIVALIMYLQSFCNNTTTTDKFIQIMEENGYSVEDSTDRIQKEFGMGSIITDSHSVNTNNFRIDFCVLNTPNNANMLFDSARLPADSTVIHKDDFVSAQNDKMYFVKAYRSNTFIYAACEIENKDNLLRLLKDLDYYDIG